MDRRLYENAIAGSIQTIMELRSMGAQLEWKDREGKTPLIVVCQRHDRFDVAKMLVDLGANVNAYRHGRNGGTPLHHAVMRGLDQTVKLLLENGANPFVKNDDGYTALDLARKRGRFIIVRAIEKNISIFSGWLRAEFASVLSGVFRPILSDFRPGNVWAVVVPTDTIDLTWPPKLELMLYLAHEVAQPFEVINLMETHIEPKFDEPDPFVVVVPSGTRYKLFSEYWGQKQQIKLFYDACRGIHEVNDHTTTSSSNLVLITPPSVQHGIVSRSTYMENSASEQHLEPRTIPVPGIHRTTPISTGTSIISASTTAPHLTDLEEIELAQVIKASIETAISEGVDIEPHLMPETSTTGTTSQETFCDASPCQDNDLSTETSRCNLEEKEARESNLCIVCLDSRAEAACIPCGHMAGCFTCLKMIQTKSRQCPVCRAFIHQIIKIYAI